MAQSNVTKASGIGWVQVFEDGHSKGWAYRYRLRLECGHTKLFVTQTFVNRVQDAPAPAWVDCKECDQ